MATDRLSIQNDRAPLGAGLAQLISERIREQGLTDGDPLPSERELAEIYGASMHVVRDALRILTQQGAIRTSQGRPAEVSQLRPIAIGGYFRLMLNIYENAPQHFLEFRTMLEVTAAGIAAKRITDPQLNELTHTLDRIEKLGNDHISERAKLDLAFHLGIATGTGNQFLTATMEALNDVLATEFQRGVTATESVGKTHDESDTEHRALLTALRAHNPTHTEQLMRSHLDRVRQTILTWKTSTAPHRRTHRPRRHHP